MKSKKFINKAEVDEIVSIFYRTAFKSFYVNKSETDYSIRGVFISLGITSSLDTLRQVKESIELTGEYKTELCEIVSYPIGEEGTRYINVLERKGEEITEQFKIDPSTVNEGTLLDRETALKELQYRKDGDETNLRTTKELESLIEKIESLDGWQSHSILRNFSGEFSLYHKTVNYIKDSEGLEHRIGIFVTKK